MTKKIPTVLPLATALAALGGAGITEAGGGAATTVPPNASDLTERPAAAQPNGFMTLGEDILAFTVTQKEDGTVVAQHSSHYSHSSHASHASHHSSRY